MRGIHVAKRSAWGLNATLRPVKKRAVPSVTLELLKASLMQHILGYSLYIVPEAPAGAVRWQHAAPRPQTRNPPSCTQAHKFERLFLTDDKVDWQPKATSDAFHQQPLSNTRWERMGSGSLAHGRVNVLNVGSRALLCGSRQKRRAGTRMQL